MKLVAVGLLLLTLAGCTQYMWMRTDGKNDQAAIDQFRKDSYECERDMRQNGYYGQGVYAAIEAQNFGERCLQARGYKKVPADATAINVHNQ